MCNVHKSDGKFYMKIYCTQNGNEFCIFTNVSFIILFIWRFAANKNTTPKTQYSAANECRRRGERRRRRQPTREKCDMCTEIERYMVILAVYSAIQREGAGNGGRESEAV